MDKQTFPFNKEMAISEVFTDEKFAIFLRSDFIIQVHMADGVECDHEDCRKIVEIIGKVCDGKKYPLMAIYGSFDTFTKEGMNIISNHPHSLADALVTNQHWAIELIAKFYLKRFPPIRPTKLFSTEEAAVNWLKSIPLNQH